VAKNMNNYRYNCAWIEISKKLVRA